MADGNVHPGSWAENEKEGVLEACLCYDLKDFLNVSKILVSMMPFLQ